MSGTCGRSTWAPGRQAEILTGLGFVKEAACSERCRWQAPSWRRDVTREIDLVEEIARIEGYDNVPEDRPIHAKPVEQSARERTIRVAGEVLVAAAEANVTETIRACEAALAAGARAVAVVSPFYYRLSPESVYAYFREIGRLSPIDVTLYNIPMLASPIDVPTVKRLAEEFPRIIGIKDSSGDISQMIRLIAAVRPVRPDFTFLTGWDPGLVPMLAVGCDGGTHATSGVAPELTRRIYDTVRAGDIDAAMGLQRQLVELFDPLIQAPDFPEGFRVGAEARGFKMGASRQPATEAQTASRKQLAERVRKQLDVLGLR